MQSMPITTDVVSSNLDQGDNIMFVSDFRQVDGISCLCLLKSSKNDIFVGCSPPAANDLYFVPPPIKHKFSKNSLAFGIRLHDVILKCENK